MWMKGLHRTEYRNRTTYATQPTNPGVHGAIRVADMVWRQPPALERIPLGRQAARLPPHHHPRHREHGGAEAACGPMTSTAIATSGLPIRRSRREPQAHRCDHPVQGGAGL
jgi:hypothetical protein